MIWKYPLQNVPSQQVQMPKGAQILSVQSQREQLQLWALVDSNQKEMTNRTIWIIGTGQMHPPASSLRYISTAQTFGGDFVWHVFEEIF